MWLCILILKVYLASSKLEKAPNPDHLSTTIAQATAAVIKPAPAAIIQRIKHPEKAMKPGEATAILREMQQQTTDADKINVLKPE